MILFFILSCISYNIIDSGICEENVSDLAIGLTEEQRQVSNIIENELKQIGLSDNLIAASIVNAYAESRLNPNAVGDRGNSIGLFQLNKNGLGNKLTIENRHNVYTNTNVYGLQLLKNKNIQILDESNCSIPILSAAITEHIMKPQNVEQNKIHRMEIAQKMFPERL